jgi:hypothetical protein
LERFLPQTHVEKRKRSTFNIPETGYPAGRISGQLFFHLFIFHLIFSKIFFSFVLNWFLMKKCPTLQFGIENIHISGLLKLLACCILHATFMLSHISGRISGTRPYRISSFRLLD